MFWLGLKWQSHHMNKISILGYAKTYLKCKPYNNRAWGVRLILMFFSSNEWSWHQAGDRTVVCSNPGTFSCLLTLGWCKVIPKNYWLIHRQASWRKFAKCAIKNALKTVVEASPKSINNEDILQRPEKCRNLMNVKQFMKS